MGSGSTSTPSRGRVLFVANTDWYLYNFRQNLLASAQAQGWQVSFASPAGEYFDRLESLGYQGHAVELDAPGTNPWREFKALVTLARIFRRTKPDVVHLFTLKCVLYGCLVAPASRRTRVVGAITGMGHLFTTQSWRTRLLKRPVLLALKVALRVSKAHIIFQNDADRDEFVDYRLLPKPRTSVIRGSGVDCERFRPGAARTSAPNANLKILFCGRLIREKGVYEYLAATAQLRKAGYTFESRIAGGPYPGNPSSLSAAEVDRLASESEHVYLGHHDDMAGLLAETDIVVLPTYREGTPKALLEAAASGCMIVTTDIPGCHGIVEPGANGYLVEPRQVEPLVTAIRQVLNATPEQHETMRQRSRQIAMESFSDVQVNSKTLALYDDETESAYPRRSA